MPGIGSSQLLNNLTTRDPVNARLARTASTANNPSGNIVWDPTSRFILGREETDKQNEDNISFLFEYRALINSRLQTIITQLSNALASDLDVAMNASNTRWGTKSAMSGVSTTTMQDPGAARTAFNFLMGWKTNHSAGAAASFTNPPAATPAGTNLPDTPYNDTFSAASGNIVAQGTSTLVQTSTANADIMTINNNTFLFTNTVNATGYDISDDSFSGPLGQAALSANAKNLTEKVMYDLLSSVEYRSVLNSGLFKNVIVSASSSLATGSQAQASLNITYQGTQRAGQVNIILDKFTAFYHS